MATPLMYVPNDNRFQNQMFSLLSNVIMQKIAYNQQDELMTKRQEYETNRENERTQLQLGMAGYTPMSQEETMWQQSGQVKPDLTVAGKGYNRPKWQKVAVGGKQLGFQRGNQFIQTSQKEDYFKIGNELVKVDDGKAVPIYESKSGEKEWKPSTLEEKRNYDKWIINERAKAQQRYRVRDPKITTTTDSNGNVTKLVFDNSGKLVSKEDLGQIGRKGTTNIFDLLNNPNAGSQPTETQPQGNGFKGEGYYMVDGEQVIISSQEEFDKLMSK